MRIARKLSADQEIINRFIAVLGGGMIELSSNKLDSVHQINLEARPADMGGIGANRRYTPRP